MDLTKGEREGEEKKTWQVWKNKGIGRECVVLQYPFKPKESSSLSERVVQEGTTKAVVVCECFRWRSPVVREIFTNIRGLGNKGLPVSILFFFFPPYVRTSIIILEYKFQDLIVPRPWMNHQFHLQFIEMKRKEV